MDNNREEILKRMKKAIGTFDNDLVNYIAEKCTDVATSCQIEREAELKNLAKEYYDKWQSREAELTEIVDKSLSRITELEAQNEDLKKGWQGLSDNIQSFKELNDNLRLQIKQANLKVTELEAANKELVKQLQERPVRYIDPKNIR